MFTKYVFASQHKDAFEACDADLRAKASGGQWVASRLASCRACFALVHRRWRHVNAVPT